MMKPKIQSLIPLILRRPQILLLLLQRVRVPNFCSRSISKGIVYFGESELEEIETDDSDEDLVASAVVRGVVCQTRGKGGQIS